MIFVRLMGGLGNQMFQYALARKLAINHSTNLILDLSHLDNQPEGEVPREYELDCFNISGKLIHQPAESYRTMFFRKLNLTIVREKSLGYNPEILKTADNSLLIGYWQTEKYFKSIEMQIRHDFIFKKPLSKQKRLVSEQIGAERDAVSLQIRRGDYVSHSISRNFHGLVPLSFYDKATKTVARRLRNPHFFIISDDTAWCKKNLKLGYPATFIEHIPGTGQEDMNLMSQCKHQIIANSSFGWWGAWLNNNPDKIIVAPKKWFAGASTNLNDRLPKNWIKI